MKSRRTLIYKIISITLVIILSSYVIGIGFQKKQAFYSKTTTETKIYTIWHIETFEGGGKSRLDYIKNTARSIEKTYNGVLFMIKTLTPEMLSSSLAKTQPDIISFGYGIGEIILPYLTNFNNTYNVRDELISSGMFNNKLYAIPYIVSGYAMINHSANYSEFHCGQNNYIAPENIYAELSLQPIKYESQYESYKAFVNNKNVLLLGTARDVFRINNLNNIGRTNAMITPIDTYTDLIQYVGIIKWDNTISTFINSLLSTDNQSSLIDYALFSSLQSKLYYNGIYNDMENALIHAEIPKLFY